MATIDHNVPTTDRSLPMIDETSSTQIKTLEKNCKDFGIKLFGINDPNQGIVHVIGPQLGITLMYVGTGERIDDLEQFSPTRFVGRLLGMGDVQAVLDLAKRLGDEADEVRMKRISSGKMNMEDFFYQLEEVTKVGSLQSLMETMPGLSGMVKEDQLEVMEKRMDKWRYIIQSMNTKEKADPDLLNSSRIKRIARGSGWPEHEVKELIKNYKNSKTMMKASKGRQMQGMLRKLGMG